MTTTLGGTRDSFLLVTLDGFSLQRRSAGATEWLDVRLGEKCCVLVAFLATMATPVHRKTICDLLWPGGDGGKSRNSLRQAIFRIRRVLGHHSLLESFGGVMLARGAVEIDLLRALEGAADAAVSLRLGPSLADAFGHTARPIGSAFDEWRSRVRTRLARGEFHAVSRARDIDGLGGGVDGLLAGQADQPAQQRLAQLYRLSSHGIPLTVWVTGRPESALRRAVDGFASECRMQGACIAAVTRRPGAGYARYALERDLAEAIWPLPGAAGIKPDHHLVLDRVTQGFPVDTAVLRTATLDLIAAVAENAPLVITLGNPGRYSLAALSSLVSELAALRYRAVLLVVAEHSGVRPVHSLCIEVALAGSPVGDVSRLADVERGGGDNVGVRSQN